MPACCCVIVIVVLRACLVWIDTQGSMIGQVPTLVQLWPESHVLSMEERIAPASALCTAHFVHCAMTTTINRFELLLLML
jgi:hypothetical protein